MFHIRHLFISNIFLFYLLLATTEATQIVGQDPADADDDNQQEPSEEDAVPENSDDVNHPFGADVDDIPLTAYDRRRQQKPLPQYPDTLQQGQNFRQNNGMNYGAYPDFGSPLSQNNGNPRIFNNYEQGPNPNPNQYGLNNGLNYQDTNYPVGPGNEAYQGQAYQNQPYPPSNIPRSGNYNPMSNPNGNVLAQENGRMVIIPGQTTRESGPYQNVQPQNRFYPPQNNPDFRNLKAYPASKATSALSTSTVDSLTLFEQKMAAIESKQKKSALDEFLIEPMMANITYIKNAVEYDKKGHKVIKGEKVSIDDIKSQYADLFEDGMKKPQVTPENIEKQRIKPQMLVQSEQQRPYDVNKNNQYQNHGFNDQRYFLQNDNPGMAQVANSFNQQFTTMPNNQNYQQNYQQSQNTENLHNFYNSKDIQNAHQYQYPISPVNSFLPQQYPIMNQNNLQYGSQNFERQNPETLYQTPPSPNINEQNMPYPNQAPLNVENIHQDLTGSNNPLLTKDQSQSTLLKTETENQNPIPSNPKRSPDTISPGLENAAALPQGLPTQTKPEPNLDPINLPMAEKDNPNPPNEQSRNSNSKDIISPKYQEPHPSTTKSVKKENSGPEEIKEPHSKNPVPQRSETEKQNPNPTNETNQNSKSIPPQESTNQKTNAHAEINRQSLQPQTVVSTTSPTTIEIDYDMIPGWYDITSQAPSTTKQTDNNSKISRIPTVVPAELPAETEPPAWQVMAAKKAMVENNMGYFTGFFYVFFTIISKKPVHSSKALLAGIRYATNQLVESGQLAPMGQPTQKALQEGMLALLGFTDSTIKQRAGIMAMLIKDRYRALAADMIPIIKILDAAYTLEQGDLLLNTLADIQTYNVDAGGNNVLVAQNAIQALLRPFWTVPQANRAKLFELINAALLKRYKFDLRRYNKPSVLEEPTNRNQSNITANNNATNENVKDLNSDKLREIYKHIDEIGKKVIEQNDKELEMIDKKLKREYKSGRRFYNKKVSSYSKPKLRMAKKNINTNVVLKLNNTTASTVNLIASVKSRGKGMKIKKLSTKKCRLVTPKLQTNKRKISKRKMNPKPNFDNLISMRHLDKKKVKNKLHRSKYYPNNNIAPEHKLKNKKKKYKYDRLKQNMYNYENTLRGKYKLQTFNDSPNHTNKSTKTSDKSVKVGKITLELVNNKNKEPTEKLENSDDSYDRDLKNTKLNSNELFFKTSKTTTNDAEKEKKKINLVKKIIYMNTKWNNTEPNKGDEKHNNRSERSISIFGRNKHKVQYIINSLKKTYKNDQYVNIDDIKVVPSYNDQEKLFDPKPSDTFTIRQSNFNNINYRKTDSITIQSRKNMITDFDEKINGILKKYKQPVMIQDGKNAINIDVNDIIVRKMDSIESATSNTNNDNMEVSNNNHKDEPIKANHSNVTTQIYVTNESFTKAGDTINNEFRSLDQNKNNGRKNIINNQTIPAKNKISKKIINNIIRKLAENRIQSIHEENQYSDEEKEFKVMLSDAIRHGDFNDNYANYRKYGGNILLQKKGQTRHLREVSSVSDEEVIFKKNIYKSFGHDTDI